MEHEDNAQLEQILQTSQNYTMENMQQYNAVASCGIDADVCVNVGSGDIMMGGKYNEVQDVGDDDELKYVEEVQQSEKNQSLKNFGNICKDNELAEQENTTEDDSHLKIPNENGNNRDSDASFEVEESKEKELTGEYIENSVETEILHTNDQNILHAQPTTYTETSTLSETCEEKPKENVEVINTKTAINKNILDDLVDVDPCQSILNPDATEFVPSFGSNQISPASPSFENKRNELDQENSIQTQVPSAVPTHFFTDDEFLAQSPRKGRGASMDSISLPKELSEFEEEADLRPHELEIDNNGLDKTGIEVAPHLSAEDNIIFDEKNQDLIASEETNFQIPVAVADHGPETSVDLDPDNGIDEVTDVMKQSIYVGSEPIEDLLNSVQPLPADSESVNNSFIEDSAIESVCSALIAEKELLQVEEKEIISNSPSTEEMPLNFESNFSSSNKDIAQIPNDSENIVPIDETLNTENNKESEISNDTENIVPIQETLNTEHYEEPTILKELIKEKNTTEQHIDDIYGGNMASTLGDEEHGVEVEQSINQYSFAPLSSSNSTPIAMSTSLSISNSTPFEMADEESKQNENESTEHYDEPNQMHNYEQSTEMIEAKPVDNAESEKINEVIDLEPIDRDEVMDMPQNNEHKIQVESVFIPSLIESANLHPVELGLNENLVKKCSSTEKVPQLEEKINEPKIEKKIEEVLIHDIEKDIEVSKQTEIILSAVAATTTATALASEIQATKKPETLKKPTIKQNTTQKSGILSNSSIAKKPISVEAKKNTVAAKTAVLPTHKPRPSPGLVAKAGSYADKKLAKPPLSCALNSKKITSAAADPKTATKSNIVGRSLSASTTPRTGISAPIRKPAITTSNLLKNRVTPGTTTTATNGQNKPTTLGVSSTSSAKSVSPRSTVTSQLRKNTGMTGTTLTAKPKSPVKPLGTVASKTLPSTVTMRTKTTTTSTLSGTVNNVTKPFTARPAPKFTTNSATHTSSTKRLGLGNTESVTTIKSAGSQLRKSSPTKTVGSKTTVKSSITGNGNPKTTNATTKIIKKPEINHTNTNIGNNTEKNEMNGSADVGLIEDKRDLVTNDVKIATDMGEDKDSDQVLLEF